MPKKACTICKSVKTVSPENFHYHKKCAGGFDSACRYCRNLQRQAWKERNRDRVLARRKALYDARYKPIHKQREREREARHPYRVQAERLLGGVWERSRELGFIVPEALRTKAFFEEWLRRQPDCESCGVAFVVGPKRKHEPNPAAPSVDRFVLKRGYDLDNICLVCWRCNNIKRNYAAADLRCVAAWMDRRVPQPFEWVDTFLVEAGSTVDPEKPENKKLIAMYMDGASVHALATMLAVTDSAVTYRLRRLGVKRGARARYSHKYRPKGAFFRSVTRLPHETEQAARRAAFYGRGQHAGRALAPAP